MELDSVKFVKNLANFLGSKYFYVVGESDTIDCEGDNGCGCGYTENVGIAVLMLSYSYRPAYKSRFCNINPKCMDEYTLACFALKFAQIYFENPSIFRILMICSCISELTISFSRSANCDQQYNFYLKRCLPFVLRKVCFDYLAENGGEIALDAVAKKASKGYKVLQKIVDGENPFYTIPIRTALVPVEKIGGSERRRRSRKSEDVCRLEKKESRDQRSLEKEAICEENQSRSTGNSKNDKNITVNTEQELHPEIFPKEESSSTNSSNIPNFDLFFEALQNLNICNNWDKEFNVATDDIADDKPEFYGEVLHRGESSIAGSSNNQNRNVAIAEKQTNVSKISIDLGALQIHDKSIDMTFGDIDDIADITTEFHEELSSTEESSMTYSSNLRRKVDMDQARVSGAFSDPTIAPKKYNKNIDITFGTLDDIADIVAEFNEMFYTKESSASSLHNTSETVGMDQSAAAKSFIDSAISQIKFDKNIDMSSSDVDMVPKVSEETLQSKESSLASSTNVQNLHETTDTKQLASAKLSEQKPLEKQDSCNKQATDGESVTEVVPPDFSQMTSKERRRNRRAHLQRASVTHTNTNEQQ